MDCDIHCFVEIKLNGKWHCYASPYIERAYALFAKMAGVRNHSSYEITPIAEPRGIPDDSSEVVKFCAKDWEGDGHSYSWLSDIEAGEVQDWFEKNHPDKPKIWHPPIFGYLFGNNIDTYVKYPQVYHKLKQLGYESARLVFWFDN